MIGLAVALGLAVTPEAADLTGRMRESASAAVIASAIATRRTAWSRCSNSARRFCTRSAPLPVLAGSSKAAITARDQATSAGAGVNTRLQISRWLGWIRVLPSKPNSTPWRQTVSRRARSSISLCTPSRMTRPCMRAAITDSDSAAQKGARSGGCRAPISLARSLTPMTKPARRVEAAMAAIEAREKIAAPVSIITHRRVCGGAPPSARSQATTSSGPEIFGTRTASGPAAAMAARSASPHGVEGALTRTTTSRRPKPPAASAATAAARASRLASGSTASSRSRMTTSHARPRAFSTARALEAGM